MKAKDRRFIKTEVVIKKSMINLLCEMNAEQIQIDDLIYEADINKSTFYLHYQSLDLLVSSLEDEIISILTINLNELPANVSRYVFFEKIFEILKNNQKLSKAVLNASTYRFNNKIEDFGKNYLIPAPSKKRNRLVSNIEFLETSLIQSIVSVYRVWIFDSCKFSIDELVQTLIDLSSNIIYKDLYR